VTKKDSDCIYCGKVASIDHSFINCQFTKSFTQEVWQLTIKKTIWDTLNNFSNVCVYFCLACGLAVSKV